MSGPVSIAEVLERNRARVAPRISASFMKLIADIEERNQFDDERLSARREIREALKNETLAPGPEEGDE